MLLKVKVSAGSRKESLERKAEDSLEIKVREKPLQGRANKRVVEMIALHLKIPESEVRLVRGFKSRSKIFEIKSKN